jgi:hypothetical protein
MYHHRQVVQMVIYYKLRNIYWIPKLKKWVVKIRANNKEMNFGYYYDLDVAKFIAENMRYK